MSAKPRAPRVRVPTLDEMEGLAQRLLKGQRLILEKGEKEKAGPAPPDIIVSQAVREIMFASRMLENDPYCGFNGAVRALAIEAARQDLDFDTAMRAIFGAFRSSFDAVQAAKAQIQEEANARGGGDIKH